MIEEKKKAMGGIAPFGYRWQNGQLVIDEAEAAVRRLICELFVKHRRKKTVARVLNDAGYRTRSGAKFSDTTIDRLVRDNSVKDTAHDESGKTAVEPIIPAKLWEQVNLILSEQNSRKEKPPKQAVQLFAGLVSCECGGRMQVPSNSPKYICQNCRRKIETADLEEIFLSHLHKLPLSDFYQTDNLNNEKKQTDEFLKQEFANRTLAEMWMVLTAEEKRLVVENLIEEIRIGRGKIELEVLLPPVSPKTAAFGQQQEELAENQHNSAIEENNSESEVVNPQSLPEESLSQNQNQIPFSLAEPLLNESQAAKFLGISKMTLLRKRTAGEIEFFRVGFRVLYSKEKHLIPFLERCEKRSQRQAGHCKVS